MTKLKDLLITRLSIFDNSLDLSEGSPMVSVVVDPVVSLFENDPLGTDIREFLTSKVEEAFPDIKITAGDALYDIVISSVSLFFEVYRREVSRISNTQSVLNVDTLSDEDADALAANWLVSRTQGSRSTCIVRIIFNRPVTFRLDDNVIFSTPAGDLFVPNGTHEVSASAMLEYQLASREYYYDLEVISLFVGADQNIARGLINAVSGLTNVLSVTNTSAATGASDKESNRELLLTKIPKSVSERSMVTVRGITAKLLNAFPKVRDLQVIGFGDVEMERDSVSIDGLGKVKSIGFAFIDKTNTKAILCPVSLEGSGLYVGDNILVSIMPTLESNGVVQSKHVYTILNVLPIDSDTPIMPKTATFVCEITPLESYGLDLEVSHVGEWTSGYATIHEPKSVSLGGVEFTTDLHLGGKADIYVNPQEDLDADILKRVRPNKYIYTGLGVSAVSGSNKVVINLDANQDVKKFKRGSYIVIAGMSPLKIRMSSVVALTLTLYVDRASDSGIDMSSNSRWFMFEELLIDLTADKEVMLPSVPGEVITVTSIIGSSVLRLDRGLNPASYGIDTSDPNNTYFINIEIEGGTVISRVESFNTHSINITTTMGLTAENQPITVYKTVNSINRPLTHINKVKFGNNLDLELPYGKSLGCRILHTGGARLKQQGLIGFVAPKYHHLFGKSQKSILPSTDMDLDSYQVLVGEQYVNGSQNNLPYSLGLGDPREKSVVLRYRVSGDEPRYSEFLAPADLFVPGDYNIFIGLGNYSYSEMMEYLEARSSGDTSFPFESNMQYPVNALSGDILNIEGGANAGDYLIDQVYQVPIFIEDLFKAGDINAFTLDQVEVPVGLSVRDIDRSKIFKLSIVRIKGRFNYSPLAMFESSFELTSVVPAIDNINALDGSVPVEAILAMLMDPSKLIKSDNTQLAEDLAEAVSLRLGAIPVDQTAARAYSIAQGLVPNSEVNYSVGSPSVGVGRLYFDHAADVNLKTLQSPFVSHNQVNKTLFESQSGTAISTSIRTSDDSFFLENKGLKFTLRSDSNHLMPLFNPDEALIGEVLTWKRDLDISRVGVPVDPTMFIPEELALDGMRSSEVSSVDVIRYPDYLVESINKVTLDQTEALYMHHETAMAYSSFYTSNEATLYFSIIPGDTTLSFVDTSDKPLESHLYSRGGIPYIEPITWTLDSAPPYAPASLTWTDPFQVKWEAARDASYSITSNDAERSILNDRVVSLVTLLDVDALIPLVSIGDGPTTADTINQLKNTYGQTILDVLRAQVDVDPSAKAILYSPAMQEDTSIPGVPSNLEDYILHPALLRFYSVVEVYDNAPLSGLLTGVTSQGSNVIYFPSKFDTLDDPFPIYPSDVKALLFIDQGDDAGGYRIESVNRDNRTVEVDRPLKVSTSNIVAKGVASIRVEDVNTPLKTLYISGSSRVTSDVDSDNIPFREVISPVHNAGLVGLGGTGRFILPSDIGNYISLYNFVRRPDSPQYGQAHGLFTPVREHLGTFKIKKVEVEQVLEIGTLSVEIVSTKVTLEGGISLTYTPGSESYMDVYFVMTSSVLPPDVNEIKGLVPIHIYETEPTKYKLIGQHLEFNASTAGKDLIISTIGYDTPSASSSVGPFIRYAGEVDSNSFVNIGMNLKNPYCLVKQGTSALEAVGEEGNFFYADVALQSMGYGPEYNTQKDVMYTTNGEQLDGFTLDISGSDTTFSGTEEVLLRVPGVNEVSGSGLVNSATPNVSQSASIAVAYRHSPESAAVQFFANTSSERVVCSHIRSKRMIPAYLGVELFYIGGSNTKVVAKEISRIIDNSVHTKTPFSVGDLVHAVHSKGASRVLTPVAIYYLVIDRERRRHLKFVYGEFSHTALAEYSGSLRTTALLPASLKSPILGVSINVKQEVNTSSIGGN
jgi:hypothetical protein